MLKIQELNFAYREENILKDINYFIDKKDFIGIIGPNGSGKSTLLKNLSNILKPDKGTIYLDKTKLNDFPSDALARKMAVVPQNTVVNFNFTVSDMIMMGRNPYQDRWGRVTSEDKTIVKEAMELTDTTDFKERNLNQLSGGERQRVIIARALAQKPEILLLDEPTASLDINYQGEIFDLLSLLNNRLEITIITVSHDLNLTAQYCDKIVLINKGEIYDAGKPSQVITEKNINTVYQTEVLIKEDELTKRPYVTVVPRHFR